MLRPQGSLPLMNEVKVWDPVVRVGHWSLVVLFAVAYLSGEVDVETLHAWAGYAILGIVAVSHPVGIRRYAACALRGFRLRLADDVAYARSLFTRGPKHYLGHNPLGGWMIVALLVTLLLA